MADAQDRFWLRSYPAGVPATVEHRIESRNSLADLLTETAETHGDATAFSCLGRGLTFRETLTLARDFAGFLQSIGVARGDRVALMMPNCLQYPVAMFGVLLAGAVVVNVNPLYTPRELAHQLRDSGATVIVALDAAARTVAAAREGTALRQVVTTGIGDLLSFPRGAIASLVLRRRLKVPPARRLLRDALPFRRAIARGRRHGFERVALGPQDFAFLQYTGGTTGVAKGATLTHRNIVANIEQCNAWLGAALTAGGRVSLCLLPMYHVFSLTANVLLMWALGGESILVPNPRDVPGTLRMIGRRHFDALCGTNTLFANLLDSAEFRARDFSKLTVVISGGMAMQSALAERWRQATGVPITEGYGLTESSPVLCVNPIDPGRPERMAFSGTVGLPVPSTEIRMRRADGSWAEVGEEGEICARGPQVMLGYWKRPEDTAKTIDPEGWLATGDVGVMDERGFVRIVDRLKDMIIVSGFNVYPTEIEDVVAKLDGVRECAAVGVKHEIAGERVKIVIVPRDESLTREAVIAHCRKHLTGYKVPHVVEFRAEPLPKTNVGKILRRELQNAPAAEAARETA